MSHIAFSHPDITPSLLRYSQEDGITAYYGALGADIVSSTGAPTVGNLYAAPFFTGLGGSIDQIGFNVTVAGAVGSVARCGIFDSRPDLVLPDSLLLDGGEYDTTITGAKLTTLSTPLSMPANSLWWLAFICGVAAPTITTFSSGWHVLGRNASFNAQRGRSKVGAGYGALPSVWPADPTGIDTSTGPLVVVRFARYNRPIDRLD